MLKTLTSKPSAAGQERLLAVKYDPLFTADWNRVLMLHYEVDANVLQPFVPFELDLRDGKAYVSLVAFTMQDLTPQYGGNVAKRLFKPMATHEFLNVRTYVKHRGEPGIYFLAEWLPNLLSVALGRPIFGLPYRWGKLHYEHAHEEGFIKGEVTSATRQGSLKYRADLAGRFSACEADSVTEFLMERYTAFTDWRGWKRLFRIWHRPWQQCAVDVDIAENTLMPLAGTWAHAAKYIGANYSPGAPAVWMGRPLKA